jgi:hypothetical protein
LAILCVASRAMGIHRYRVTVGVDCRHHRQFLARSKVVSYHYAAILGLGLVCFGALLDDLAP